MALFYILLISISILYINCLESTKHSNLKLYASSIEYSNYIIFSNNHVIDIKSNVAQLHLNNLLNGEKEIKLESHNIKNLDYLEHKSTLLLIHINLPITNALKSNIEALLSVKLDTYLPHHTYLISKEFRNDLDLIEFVKLAITVAGIDWIGKYRSEYKLNSNLYDGLKSRTDDHDISFDDEEIKSKNYKHYKYQGISALFKSLPNKENCNDLLNRMLIDLRSNLPDSDIWSVHYHSSTRVDFIVPKFKDLIPVANYLSSYPSVIAVEHKSIIEINNKWSRGILQYGSPPVYSNISNNFIQGTNIFAELSGQGEVIGVADSGIDVTNCMFYDHDYERSFGELAPFLPTSLLENNLEGVVPSLFDLSHRKIIQYINASDSIDDTGHGTHVCGSIAGNIQSYFTSNTNNLYMFDGMAYNAKLQFYDTGASGLNPNIPPILYLLKWSYTAGARIHSDSWGSIDTSYTSHSMNFDEFLWFQRDMIALIAAGNNGENGFSTVYNPSNAKNVISVGASQNDFSSWTESDCIVNGGPGYFINATCGTNSTTHNKNNMASFSSMGPTKDGRLKPDLVSVGDNVISAKSLKNGPYNTCPNLSYSDNLVSDSGTSMATPILAGHVAIVRQFYREGWWKFGIKSLSDGFIPSGSLMKATIINAGVALSGIQDIGCCGSSDFPDTNPDHGHCCCDDIDCSRKGESGIYRQLPTSLPNFIQGFGLPIISNVLKIGVDNNFNVLQLFRNQSSVVYYDPLSVYPQKVDEFANLGDSVVLSGETHEQAVCAFSSPGSSKKPFKVTLVWTDYPSSLNAGINLVNNLDLVVTVPKTFTTYYGNGGLSADYLNNVEQVSISSELLAITPYIIKVIGISVPQGPQPFSVIASGPIILATGSKSEGWVCPTTDSTKTTSATTNIIIGVVIALVIIGIALAVIYYFKFIKVKEGYQESVELENSADFVASTAINYNQVELTDVQVSQNANKNIIEKQQVAAIENTNKDASDV